MRSPLPPTAAVLAFIDRINQTDLEGLLALMTDDHYLKVMDEAPLRGKEAQRPAWDGYFTAYPDYVIYPSRIAASGATVAVLGTTTGSHLGLPDEAEMKLTVIWRAEVRDGLLASWEVLEDTPGAREALGLA
ncbi:MAG TPA: nuclear transport factor 2 family protein [Dehalococcoidia bacterium]|nr:nuclear transport factor 2 family protein [Dehalococcoidia bacterium]